MSLTVLYSMQSILISRFFFHLRQYDNRDKDGTGRNDTDHDDVTSIVWRPAVTVVGSIVGPMGEPLSFEDKDTDGDGFIDEKPSNSL